jgi:hypothetical protein
MSKFKQFLSDVDRTGDVKATLGNYNIKLHGLTDTVQISVMRNNQELMNGNVLKIGSDEIILPDSIYGPIIYRNRIYYFDPTKVQSGGDIIHNIISSMGYYRFE